MVTAPLPSRVSQSPSIRAYRAMFLPELMVPLSSWTVRPGATESISNSRTSPGSGSEDIQAKTSADGAEPYMLTSYVVSRTPLTLQARMGGLEFSGSMSPLHEASPGMRRERRRGSNRFMEPSLV